MIKALCIDIGATSAKCALFEDNKTLFRFFVDTTNNKDIVKRIHEKFNKKCEESNIKADDLSFIGIACAGLVDSTNGIVVLASNLGWKDYPLLETTKKLFKSNKVFILNDAKAATYGEWKLGLKGKKSSMALYCIGTGIGGGAIFDNKLVMGDSSGLPSEPGHGGGYQNTIKCACGLEGCIDPISSATWIEKQLNLVGSKSTGKLGELYKLNNNLHIIDIVDLFKEKDKEVISIFEEAVEPLAKSMSTLIHFLDFETFVIAGGPSNLGQPLLDIIKNQLKRFTLPNFLNKLDLRTASLTNWSGTYGVYEYGKDNYKD
ncbi:ROK family protein [Spiroplasma apis]|uniref:Glucokinase n=1 Tax=Spiroplasma apis B31 TaxID=1276258 RepID=V5RKK2_SPIAP|nr:ROK family protein [Spiroplasma apis]AHB36636.1 glucokinase [Spiroplasma apis B31]